VKYTSLFSIMLISSSFINASEVVIAKRAPLSNSTETNLRAYVTFHHRDACETTKQLLFWFYKGEIHKIHEQLDTLGDLSSLSTKGLRGLILHAVRQQEFVLLRRLLSYKRVQQEQEDYNIPSLIRSSQKKCPPIAVLVSKALLIGVACGEKDVVEIKKKYLRKFDHYHTIRRLRENALLTYITTLDWDRSRELAEEYASDFTFQDAVERGEHTGLVKSLPKVSQYEDEFGEPADKKAFRLGHRDISCQIRIYHSFADKFVPFILHGSEEELRRAALLIYICPALASELVKNNSGQTVLHAGVISKNRCLIELILMTNPDLLFVEDKAGFTPIHLMLFEGRQDILLWLVEGAKKLEALDKQKAQSRFISSLLLPVVSMFRYITSVARAIQEY
jgi:hypothetical protein